MDLVLDSAPIPSDYFGVLWALAGIKKSLILEHGATGTNFYNNISFGVMNKQSPKEIIYSTGLDEDDVVMGRDTKIIAAAKELDQLFHPNIISLVATGVTSVIGLDLHGLIQELQPSIQAKLLAFSGGGFQGTYIRGIKEVFSTLITEIASESTENKHETVNIIGPTIDSYNNPSDISELNHLLSMMGISCNMIFTADTTIQDIKNISSASLNIVTRDIALETAELLKQKFGTPYLYGLPFGIRGTFEWLEKVAHFLGVAIPHRAIAYDLHKYGYTLTQLSSAWNKFNHVKVVICCPYDYAIGLTRFIREEWEIEVSLVCLPIPPENNRFMREFQKLGVKQILLSPGIETLQSVLKEIRPQIIFGNSYDFELAPEIPIRIHASTPSYDYLNLFDGTPFLGFRGNLYLNQKLLNEISKHQDVLLS